MRTKYLSREEKLLGQKHYYRFQMLNGAGYNFLGDTIVYLLAIYYGASNMQLGYISSAGFIMGILLPLVPRLLKGRNLIAVQSVSWFFRGSVGLGYGVLFFLSGQTAVWVILLLYTLFCLFRLVGVVVINPLLNHISSSSNRGEVSSQINIAFQSVSIVAKLISTVVISLKALTGYIGLILIQFLGFIVNTVSVFELRRVPCRATIEVHEGRNLRTLFIEAMKKKNDRSVLLLVWMNISLFVIIGLIIPFLRKEFGYSNGIVMLYSALTGISAVLASMYVKAVGDRMGSKPFLIIGGTSQLLLLLMWVCLPTTSPIYLVFSLGFLTTFFIYSNNLFISRLLLHQIPEDEGFLYNTMSNFVIAIVSFITGLLGGYLIDRGILLYRSIETRMFLNNHLLLFGMAAVITVLMMLLIRQVEEPETDSGSSSVKMLFTFHGLRAYVDISRLGRIKNPLKKQTILHSISDNANDMATDEISRLLASPLSSDKTPVIHSLFHHKRYSLMHQLIAIAADPDSYQQLDAIFALGSYKHEDVEHALLEIYRSYDDHRFKSAAAKALSRIGYKDLAEDVLREASAGHPIWVEMNYLISIKNMVPEKMFSEGLFIHVRLGKSRTYRQTVYSLYANMSGFLPSLPHIFQGRNMRRGQGLKEFLEDTRDTKVFFDCYGHILSWFRAEDWKSVVDWCVKAVSDKECDGMEQHLKDSIMEADELVDSFDHDDALACFYFTYQLLRE